MHRLGLIARSVVLVGAIGVAGAADAGGRGRSAVAKIAPRTADDLPNVQSASAVVFDLETGDVLYAKSPDEVRHIASTGKIFVGLAARKRHLDLDGETEITDVDRELARGGARTHLQVGYHYTNHDLLRAMLVASDNRAPSAIGRAMGLDVKHLLAELNAVAAELGLRKTHFTDPPGLRGNVSTAREMAIAFRAAIGDPVLRGVMASREVVVTSIAPRQRAIKYFNTNRALRSGRFEVIGGKTGYTDEAGYCLVIAARVGERKIGMALLGSYGKLTRYGDFHRVVDWILDGMPNSAKAVAGVRSLSR